MPSATSAKDIGLAEHEGMYLTFRLAEETYGLPILKAREIIGVLDITRVPMTRRFLKGVINLRGKVIPTICLRTIFEMEEAEHTGETCIIVVESHGDLIGVIVDAVSEVLEIKGRDIEPPPDFSQMTGSQGNSDFVLGVCKVAERVIALLNIDAILAIEDFASETCHDTSESPDE